MDRWMDGNSGGAVVVDLVVVQRRCFFLALVAQSCLISWCCGSEERSRPTKCAATEFIYSILIKAETDTVQ